MLMFDPDEGEARAVTMMPVGPVADRFRKCAKFISTIMGPYGSAKTTTCFQKILNVAMWQHPSPIDGVRRIRVCVIRATYAQLQTNVMEDWFSWFPKTKDNWNGEQNKHRIVIDIPNFGRIEIEMLFRAMGDLKAEQVFKGMQLTLLWLNEVDTLDLQVLKFGLPRVGRYPAAKDGGCAWSGLIADMNAPDVDNWTYDLLVNKQLDIPDELLAQLQASYGQNFGIEFHRQPGGREPEAENLTNLPDGYYDRMTIGMSENEVRRFVDNEFGAVNNGQPVYPEFNDGFHVAREPLKAIPGVPISAALDGGMTPAMLFGQEDADGQIRVLDELVIFNAEEARQLSKLGPTAFARVAREFVDRRWPGARFGELWGDPAAFFGGDDEDLSWAQTFGKEFGLRVKPSPVKGNRLTLRLEAVRSCLTINVGSKPGLLVSPTAKHLRRGFNNGYVIQRVKLSNGSGRWKDEPDKNDFSHVHDALQYLVCGFKKRGNPTQELDARAARRRSAERVSFGDSYFSGMPGATPRLPARQRKRG
ncbi:MAG TPA: hypothetical protein VF628_02290 [Allosphingosinicella sp.]|jgi:hypothetical protein